MAPGSQTETPTGGRGDSWGGGGGGGGEGVLGRIYNAG